MLGARGIKPVAKSKAFAAIFAAAYIQNIRRGHVRWAADIKRRELSALRECAHSCVQKIPNAEVVGALQEFIKTGRGYSKIRHYGIAAWNNSIYNYDILNPPPVWSVSEIPAHRVIRRFDTADRQIESAVRNYAKIVLGDCADNPWWTTGVDGVGIVAVDCLMYSMGGEAIGYERHRALAKKIANNIATMEEIFAG